MDLQEFARKLAQFDFEQVVNDAVRKNDEKILALNKKQLFSESIQADGSKVLKIKSHRAYPDQKSFYSITTQRMHEGESFSYDGETKRKIAGQPYHLLESGQWFRSFVLKEDQKGWNISGVKIADEGGIVDMEDNFGKNIYGLTEKSKEKLNEILKTDIQNICRQILGL